MSTNTDQQKRTAVNTATINFAKSVRNNAISKVIDVIQTATTNEPTSKITPTLTVGTIYFDLLTEPNTTTITYNGDGNLYLFDFTDNAQATISGATLTVANADGTFKVGATEGTNYAVATPVTVTVISGNAAAGSAWFIDGQDTSRWNVLTEDTEVTAAIKQRCKEGLNDKGDILAYWSEGVQDELKEFVETGYVLRYVATVQLVEDMPIEFPVTVIYKTGSVVVDDGDICYVIFAADETVSDYILCEATGQSDGSITFDLIMEFTDEYPTMIILQA